jgi:formate dehydrogenase major subunit
VELTKLLEAWPVVRQLREGDPTGRGRAAQSDVSRALKPRIDDAEVTESVCPFCAVGCAQLAYVKHGVVIHVEGDPASPISRGRLCPKGSATKSLHDGARRVYEVKYRPPYATDWQSLPLDEAMNMIADRFVASRAATWQDETDKGEPARRTMGIANLGGATLDNEENYLIKKLLTALGVVQVENQARI